MRQFDRQDSDDMAKSLHVVLAGLRDLVNIFVEGEGEACLK